MSSISSSIVKVTALSGAYDDSPPSYLLQVDQFRFLLDCGWDEHYDVEKLSNLKKQVHQIDAVLISHPDIYHLGALPYAYGKLGLTCPIFVTVPVYRMGQMFLYDLYQSRYNSEDFTLFNLDDVDGVFDHMTKLKYSQTFRLQGKGQGLAITPLPAGHMVGGTIWKIVKDDEEEIVYAVDFNHRKERHLDGAMFESLSRPHLLIIDAQNTLTAQERRKERDQKLISTIQSTLRNNGNVLLPVDTAGRVLELAQLLESQWRNADKGLHAYTIALLNNVSCNVMDFAKAQVEWMSEHMMKMFEDNRTNPFQFKHIKLCHSLSEVNQLNSPKVVLASFPDLETGFARELFASWSSATQNSVIFTSQSSLGTLARSCMNSPPSSMELEMKRRVLLSGKELEEFLQKKEEDKEVARLQEEVSSSDSEDEGMETDQFHSKKGFKHDFIRIDEKKNKHQFFKSAAIYHLMYPCNEERIVYDDYGEQIRYEDYVTTDQPKEEKQDPFEEPIEPQPEEEQELPSKCIVTKELVDIKCSFSYVDYEGRSDGESIKRILTVVKPRQIILVHGTEEASLHLKEFCLKTLDLPEEKVFVPKLGECVKITSDIRVRQVKLRDSLMCHVSFAPAKEMDLAWVDCQINYEEPLDKGEGGDKEEALPILDALPPTKTPEHSTIFINPPRLSDFKHILNKAGYEAEFSGGALICNHKVAITRPEGGRICIEGAISEDYYRVRELLYKQFAIL